MFQLLSSVSNNKPQSKGLVTNKKSSLSTDKENFYIDRNTSAKKVCTFHASTFQVENIPLNMLSARRYCSELVHLQSKQAENSGNSLEKAGQSKKKKKIQNYEVRKHNG